MMRPGVSPGGSEVKVLTEAPFQVRLMAGRVAVYCTVGVRVSYLERFFVVIAFWKNAFLILDEDDLRYF